MGGGVIFNSGDVVPPNRVSFQICFLGVGMPLRGHRILGVLGEDVEVSEGHEDAEDPEEVKAPEECKVPTRAFGELL